jgi:hypothetical protein
MVSPGPPAPGEPILASPGPPVAGSCQIDPTQDVSSSVETQSSSSQLTGGQSVEPTAGGGEGVDPAAPGAGEQVSDPYTGGQSIDPYTGGESTDPFTGQSSADPFTGGQSVSSANADPFTGGQSADPYTGGVSPAPPDAQPFSSGADVSSASAQSSSTGVGPGIAMGAVDPANMTPEELEQWNEYLESDVSTYDFDASDEALASARYDAKVNAFDDFAESVESGTYSPRSFATMENITPDTAVDIADAWESGQSYAKFTGEPGAVSPVDSSDVPSIQNDPINPENAYLNDPTDHLGNDHLGDTTNDPGDYADPNADVNAEMDSQFGEGANLQDDWTESQLDSDAIGPRSQAGTDFLNEQGYSAGGSPLDESAGADVEGGEGLIEGGESFIEGGEGLVEGLEGAATVVEVGAEGFEAADLLVLLIFL